MDDDDSSPIAQEERTSVALCFTLSGQTVHIGAAVRSLVRSADDEAAMRAAGDDRHKTHFLTLYELRDTLQLTDLDALLVREAPFFAFLPAASDGASSSVRDKIEKLLERHDVDVRTASVLKGAFRWPTSSSPGKRAAVEATLASALGEESLSARDMTTLAPDERPLAAGALTPQRAPPPCIGSIATQSSPPASTSVWCSRRCSASWQLPTRPCAIWPRATVCPRSHRGHLPHRRVCHPMCRRGPLFGVAPLVRRRNPIG